MRMAAISSAGAVARPGIANKAAEPKTARGSSRRPGAAGSLDTPGGMGRHLRARRGDLDRVPVGGGWSGASRCLIGSPLRVRAG